MIHIAIGIMNKNHSKPRFQDTLSDGTQGHYLF